MIGLSAVLFCPPNGCRSRRCEKQDEYNVENGVKNTRTTVKETGCISLYWGGIVFFSSLSFWGVGDRGGMVLLHVNDPPFFTTPCWNVYHNVLTKET